MKLLIDLQGYQSASRTRGIGRYSLALSKALVRNKAADDEVVLLANGAFSEVIEPLRQEFEGLGSQCKFIVFDVEGPVAEIEPPNAARARLAELVRERMIDDIGPDFILLTSLFEGFIDDAVTSIGQLPGTARTAVVLYDLIPYIRPDPDWPSNYAPYYARKIESLKRADLLLSISQYAKTEATQAIPELEPRIVNISSACDERFRSAGEEISPQRRQVLFARYGISGRFVMSAGNIESRKNFEALVSAVALLPEELRASIQVVIVGSDAEQAPAARLREVAERNGLAGRVIITGHVADDDLRDLYRLCDVFVFPSRHEGFGLPPLEAMSCGAVVLGSDATSVPEVIGTTEALFNPEAAAELASLLQRALTDSTLRERLLRHGASQAAKFSWDHTAQTAWTALKRRAMEAAASPDFSPAPGLSAGRMRPRLAMVSPLPPQQSGIADYAAELIPALAEHYDLTLVNDDPEAVDASLHSFCSIRSIEWFQEHADDFERIVYQMGNSPFHAHMLGLLQRHPGIVVLHDVFLSSLGLWLEQSGYEREGFVNRLLESHGYAAVRDCSVHGEDEAKRRWPASFDVVDAAQAVIVHSRFSQELIRTHYGPGGADKVVVTRHHRRLPQSIGRDEARRGLGVAPGDFLVCAFGFMDPTKLNERLLEAWERSTLATSENCHLVFVGGRGPTEYAAELDRRISGIDRGRRISITGYCPREMFEEYLKAADVAVQLRTLSRGETSGTVLDCMAYGVPLVINAHAAMKEYPDDVVVKLADEFKTEDLVDALERLRWDNDWRRQLSQRASQYVATAHEPAATARAYREIVEETISNAASSSQASICRRFWACVPAMERSEETVLSQQFRHVGRSLARPTVYLDITSTLRSSHHTGVERTAKALLRELMLCPPQGYRVVPVQLVEGGGGLLRARWANPYLQSLGEFQRAPSREDLVTPRRGDWLIGLDVFADGVPQARSQGFYDRFKALGAKVAFVVYDVLPVTNPEWFPPWASEMLEGWLQAVTASADVLYCISQSVREEVARWAGETQAAGERLPELDVLPLGSDLGASFPSRGVPDDAAGMLARMQSRVTFLMVGTVEPRKGHAEAVAAFERLWQDGADLNLVIVGGEGWKQLPDGDRRNIPAIARAIRESREYGKRLFWLESVSDEYLEQLYARSDCLLAASEGEGFGLPLVESARRGVPVLARDIQVFREVGDGWAAFFETGKMVSAVQDWLGSMGARSRRPPTSVPQVRSWQESASWLSDRIGAARSGKDC